MKIFKFYGQGELGDKLQINLIEGQEISKYFEEKQPNLSFPSHQIEYIDLLTIQENPYFELLFDAESLEVFKIRQLELTSYEIFLAAINETIKDNSKLLMELKAIKKEAARFIIDSELLQDLIDRMQLYSTEFIEEFKQVNANLFEKYSIQVDYVKGDESDEVPVYRKVSRK